MIMMIEEKKRIRKKKRNISIYNNKTKGFLFNTVIPYNNNNDNTD